MRLYAHGQNTGRWSTKEQTQESRRQEEEGGAGQDICWSLQKGGTGGIQGLVAGQLPDFILGIETNVILQ